MKRHGDGMEIVKIFAVVWIVMIILLFLGWESRTHGYTWEIVSEDKELILLEMPSLEITETESAAGQLLWEAAVIKNALADATSDGYLKLSDETVEELFGNLIPENAETSYVEVGQGDIVVRYSVMNLSTALCYYRDDKAQTIKIVNVDNSMSDINKRLLYINYGNKSFEKQKETRIWFDQTRKLLGNIFD